MMKKNKKILILIAILAVVAVLFSGAVKDILEKKDKSNIEDLNLGIITDIRTIESSDLTKTINYIGTLEADESTVISSKLTSQIVNFYVKEGDMVNQGDPICQLDDSTLRASLETMNTKLQTLRLNGDYLSQELNEYYDNNPMIKKIETLEINLQYIADEEATYKILYDSGAIAKTNYDKVNHEKTMMQMQIEEAKATATDNYEKLKNQYEVTTSQLKELQASVNELDLKTQDSNIVSPISGRIRIIYYQNGDLATSGKPIAIVDNINNLIVKVDISELDLNVIKEGLDVNIKLPGIEQIYEAKVSKIFPSVDEKTRVGKAEVLLSNEALKNVLIGSSAEVRFIVNKIENEIVISKSYIKTLDGLSYVYVVKDKIAVQKEIQTGVEVGDEIQVISGLDVGEQIATSNLNRIYDGAKIYSLGGDE